MKGLLLVTMEPPAALEDEFNDWYDTEHFPQRRGLPGFESASRWVCLHGWPRWVALYDLTSIDAIATPEYAAVSGSNSTPWSRRLLPRMVGRSRVVAEQVEPGDEISHPTAQTSQLVVARYEQVVETSAAQRAGQSLTGLQQLRLFRTIGLAPQHWLIVAFDRPQSPDTLRDAFGAISGIGAQLLNIYVPYHRG